MWGEGVRLGGLLGVGSAEVRGVGLRGGVGGVGLGDGGVEVGWTLRGLD